MPCQGLLLLLMLLMLLLLLLMLLLMLLLLWLDNTPRRFLLMLLLRLRLRDPLLLPLLLLQSRSLRSKLHHQPLRRTELRPRRRDGLIRVQLRR